MITSPFVALMVARFAVPVMARSTPVFDRAVSDEPLVSVRFSGAGELTPEALGE